MNNTKSEQTKQGLHKSFQSGISKKAQTVCYGYMQNNDGILIFHPEQTSVVRAIFEYYLAGYSLGRIVSELQRKEILSPTGKPKWSCQTIDKMLSNEKYTGNVVLGKPLQRTASR